MNQTGAAETKGSLAEKFPHLSEFASIDEQRRNLKARLKALDEEAKAHEEPAMNELVEAGIDSIKVQGRTWYLKADRWARKANPEHTPDALCYVLRTADMGAYIRTGVDWQGLSALFREREDSSEYETAVPEKLASFFSLSEGYKLASRKSG